MSYLPERIDIAKVDAIVQRALNRLAIEEPTAEAVLRAAIMTDGRNALAIEAWADGVVTIAACGVELWRGPIAEISRRSDA